MSSTNASFKQIFSIHGWFEPMDAEPTETEDQPILFFHLVLRIKHKALFMLNKCSSTEPHSQSFLFHLWQGLTKLPDW